MQPDTGLKVALSEEDLKQLAKETQLRLIGETPENAKPDLQLNKAVAFLKLK